MTAAPAFTVSVATMAETHQVTYLVVLRNSRDTQSLDSPGALTPFTSAHLEHALEEAQAWADFLGVPLTPYEAPAWLADKQAQLAAMRS